MNVSSTMFAQYIPSTQSAQSEPKTDTHNDTKHTQSGTHNIDDHKLESLDDRGNELLNKILVGKTEREKTDIKVVLDGMLMLQAKSEEKGGMQVAWDKHKSEENILGKLDYKIELQKSSAGNQEILKVMEQLRELYSSDYSPLDIKA